MATISEELALKLTKDDGHYDGDPQAFAIVKYRGPYGIGHSVCYSQEELDVVANDVEIIYFLWKKGEANPYEIGLRKGHIDGGVVGLQAAVNLMKIEKKMFGELSETDRNRNKVIDELIAKVEPWVTIGKKNAQPDPENPKSN